LLQRLVRNTLENASSFAKSEVAISLRPQGNGFVEIAIRDDGPGFSDAGLENFGKRRRTRYLSASGKKVSLGLGSVIAVQITDAHHGTLYVSNWLTPSGAVGGAEVRIRLPRLFSTAQARRRA